MASPAPPSTTIPGPYLRRRLQPGPQREGETESDGLVLPERPADDRPVVRPEAEADRRDERGRVSRHPANRKEHQRHGGGGEQRRGDHRDEIRRERRVHVHEADRVQQRGRDRGEQRRQHRVRRAVMPLTVAAEGRPLREERALGDDAVEHQRVLHRDFARGELRRLRVHRPDLASVRVVDHEEGRKQCESRQSGSSARRRGGAVTGAAGCRTTRGP